MIYSGGLSGDAARKWKKSFEGRRAKWATHGRLRGSRMVAALEGICEGRAGPNIDVTGDLA